MIFTPYGKYIGMAEKEDKWLIALNKLFVNYRARKKQEYINHLKHVVAEAHRIANWEV